MSDMSASVVLRMVDDMTGPARHAAKAVKELLRDIERLNKVSKSSREDRQISRMTRDLKRATSAARELGQALKAPVSSGLRSASRNIDRITSSANRATSALRAMNRELGRERAPSTSAINRAARTAANGGSRRGNAGPRVPVGPNGIPLVPAASPFARGGPMGPWGARNPLPPNQPPANGGTRSRQGNGNGGNNNGGGNGRGGGGGGHGGGAGRVGGFFRHAMGVPAHLGSGAMHMFGHALAYQATEGVISGTIESVKSGMEQAFDRKHTEAMLRMQGETQTDIDAAVAQSKAMARSLPQFTSAQHLEAIAELRPALLGGLQEATKLAPMFQNVVGVLEAAKQGAGKTALGGLDTHGEALDLVRALEVKGVTQLGDKAMESYANNITKAIVAFNGQITAKDFHAAFKFSKFAATNWSEDFSTQILPTLMNEMKASHNASASSTGVALKSMYQGIVSNKMTPQALDAFYHLGMYKKSDLQFDKKGHAQRANTGAHMKGYDLFMTDPYKFVQDVLLPQMQASGIDLKDKKTVAAKMSELFSNRNAEYIADILALQQQLLEKDRENVKKAMGMDGLKFLEKTDPTTRMQVFASAIKELLGALGDVAFPGAMRGMKGMIDWAHHAADSIKSSTYAKALGNRFESFIGGLFGQKMGRKGLWKGGREKEYYDSGQRLSSGFGHLKSAIGGMLKFWEEAGVFTGSMKALGVACDVVAFAMNKVREACQVVADFFKGDFFAQVKADFQKIPSEMSAVFEELKGAFSGIVSWLKGNFSWMFPSEEKKAATDARSGAQKSLSPPAAVVGLRANRYAMQPQFPTIGAGQYSRKGAFDLGGLSAGADQAIHTISATANAAAPMFAQAGMASMASLAGGLQAGGGQATASMTGLMGSLAAIAAGGVTVPVRLDTSAAESQLSSLMARASRLGGPSKSPQFAGSLSDIGH